MADTTTALSNFLYGRLPQLGSEGGSATGVLDTNVTSTASPADTNENDLYSYTMPASTLSADGRAVRITAWGTTLNNANNKTMKLYFGATAISSSGVQALNDSIWSFEAVVVRTAAAAELFTAKNIIGSNSNSNQTVKGNATTLAIDTTATIIIKVTGTSGTGTAADITFKGAVVELLN